MRTVGGLQPSGALRVTGLLANHTAEPLGIDDVTPHLSWRLESDRRGVSQAAYRVVVDRLDAAGSVLDRAWDSGWVVSTSQLGIEYAGTPLEGRTRYSWGVSVRTSDGDEAASGPSAFETAFLRPSEWTAVWIACVTMAPRVASPLFRVEFTLDAPVRRARAYVSGLGYYELFLNGERVGDSVLDPAWTTYSKRVLYATHDVTGLVSEGPNAVGVALGNGWFEAMPNAVPSQLQPQLLLELHIDLTDGRRITVVTDRASGWEATIDGPILDHSLYGGETYDARREIPGWAEPGFDEHAGDARWRRAVPVEPPGGELHAQTVEPIRVVRQLAPTRVSRIGPDSQVVDFGQNFAGWVRIRLEGDAGDTITVRHAEILHNDGTVNTVNLRSAAATDRYIHDGQDARWFEPRFTYHGFRYAQVDGYPGDLTGDDLVGCVVRSDVHETGDFSCDDELLQQIQRNIVWTEGSNLHGVPTDCPQRDERLAWLNDMTVRAEQAVSNFGLARLYSKWFLDIVDTQGAATGAIADTAPHVRYGRRPADPVVSSFLIVPQLLFSHYGDRRAIEHHYDDLGRWVSFLKSLRVDGIIEQSEIGDWAPPVTEAVAGSAGAGAMSATTPGGLVSTGFLHMNLRLMARFAELLGHEGDEEEYQREAEAVRDAINDRYFDAERCAYGPGNQASNGFALYLDLVPPEHEQAVLANLVRDIEEREHHLTTGNLCTKYVMDVLGRFGRHDVAMSLLTQRTYPSWGYMVEMGATTIWERWEHVTGGTLAAMGSHNHPMYGAVGSWFYRYLAGISPDSDSPGFSRVVIEPGVPDGLNRVRCTLITPYGRLESSWTREDRSIRFAIEVPPGSTASVLLPIAESEQGESRVTEGGVACWNLGRPAEAVLGVSSTDLERCGLRMELASGQYEFEVVNVTSSSSRSAP